MSNRIGFLLLALTLAATEFAVAGDAAEQDPSQTSQTQVSDEGC